MVAQILFGWRDFDFARKVKYKLRSIYQHRTGRFIGRFATYRETLRFLRMVEILVKFRPSMKTMLS